MLQSVTTIQGEHVLLRPSQEGDAEEGARVWTPELRYMYGGSRMAPRAPAAAPPLQGPAPAKTDEPEHRFSIEADGRYIGHVGLRPNDEERSGRYRIGIVNPEYWGKGYGAEVTRLMLRYAFDTLDLHRVSLRVTAYNHRARRCYEKCGFRVEGIERESFQVDGEWQDDVLMAILKEEWDEQQASQPAADRITIRPYRSADHPAVVALLEACGMHLGQSDSAERIAWKLATQPGFFFLAEADGEVIGTVMGSLERGWGWVQRLMVHPQYRRRATARRLMQAAERAHAALGAHRACLLTGQDNTAARALYQSLGYETWDGVIVMSRDLAPREGSGEEST